MVELDRLAFACKKVGMSGLVEEKIADSDFILFGDCSLGDFIAVVLPR